MKTNILLLDSFKNAESLVAYAFSFSHRTNRQLKIMYVFDFEWMRQSYPVGAINENDPVLVNVESSASKEFEDAETKIRYIMRDYLKKHSVDVPVEVSVSDKNRVDLMQQEIGDYPDVILMISNQQSYAEASGGAMGYPNLIFQLNCPVFIIPGSTSYAVLDHVLYATDYHPDDISSLRHLAGLLQSPQLKVAVLHNEKDQDFEDNLRWKGFIEILKEHTGIISLVPVLTKEKNIIEAINSYIRESNPDLLVVLKEKRGFIKELFSTSHTKNVLTSFDKPMMVYHGV